MELEGVTIFLGRVDASLYTREGGIEFKKYLENWIANPLIRTITLDLDGATGYPSSFLKAAFEDLDLSKVRIITEDEPYLEQEIRMYANNEL